MTVEEQLKAEILGKYKSVRAFTTEIGIPYSTLDSVFKRGITNAGVNTMLKVFDALDLDIESIVSGQLCSKNVPFQPCVSVSNEAMRIAVAFDKATEDQQQMVRLALKEHLPAPAAKESGAKLA